MNDAEDQKEEMRLKQAMDEVFTVLEKHDLAGEMSLVSQTHSAIQMRLDPAWSCIRSTGDKNQYYFETKKAENEFIETGDYTTFKELVEGTLGILHRLANNAILASEERKRTLNQIRVHFHMDIVDDDLVQFAVKWIDVAHAQAFEAGWGQSSPLDLVTEQEKQDWADEPWCLQEEDFERLAREVKIVFGREWTEEEWAKIKAARPGQV